jgi:hypothetical protein
MVADTQCFDASWTGLPELLGRVTRADPAPARYEPSAVLLQRVNAKIASLMELRDDWNSYGGKRPTREAANDALRLAQLAAALGAPEPSIVPTAGGGIQLEWHVAGKDLEVECVGGGTHVVVFDNPASGDPWDYELRFGDLARLTEALRLLGSGR